MKKWCIGLMILTLVCLCSLGVYAAYGNHQNGPGQHPEPNNDNYGPPNHDQNYGIRADARSIMQRTARVLNDAQQMTEHRHYHSGLGRAVAHQEMAQKLRRNGKHLNAIFHSLRARKIAFQVIRGNGQQINWYYWWNQMEKNYLRQSPSDEELDRRIRNERSFSDQDAVHFRINLNIDL